MKKKVFLIVIAASLVMTFPPVNAQTKTDQNSSTESTNITPALIEKMFNESEGVIVGKYLPGDREKKDPPVCRYRSVEYLKGYRLSVAYPIKFNRNEKIPEPNSKWIVFVKELVPCDGAFESYNGAEGRVNYSPENYDAVVKAQNKFKKRLSPQNTDENITPALIEKMFNASEKIFVGEYKGYETDGPVTRTNPPFAIYRITEHFKGAPIAVHPRIHHPLLSADTSESNKWTFKDSMMPELGSKWILFIPNAIPKDGAYETYKGATGRVPYTEKNLSMLLQIIENHKNKKRSSVNESRKAQYTSTRLWEHMKESLNRPQIKDMMIDDRAVPLE